MIPKKPDKKGNVEYRLISDFRRLNKEVLEPEFPIPRVQEILDDLKNATYFTSLDLYSGFSQLLIDPEDREKLAFSNHSAHYNFKRLPFGLRSTPKIFVRLVANVLKNIPNVRVYIDDILIFSSDLKSHFIALERVIQKLREANLEIQINKCSFLKREFNLSGIQNFRKRRRNRPQKGRSY